MAAFTLPEGFTDFDMFMFGSALLVAGKQIKYTGRRVCARIKGAVRSKYVFKPHTDRIQSSKGPNSLNLIC